MNQKIPISVTLGEWKDIIGLMTLGAESEEVSPKMLEAGTKLVFHVLRTEALFHLKTTQTRGA